MNNRFTSTIKTKIKNTDSIKFWQRYRVIGALIYLSLCGTAELFSRMTGPFHPPAIYECSNFSASLPELDIVYF